MPPELCTLRTFSITTKTSSSTMWTGFRKESLSWTAYYIRDDSSVCCTCHSFVLLLQLSPWKTLNAMRCCRLVLQEFWPMHWKNVTIFANFNKCGRQSSTESFTIGFDSKTLFAKLRCMWKISFINFEETVHESFNNVGAKWMLGIRRRLHIRRLYFLKVLTPECNFTSSNFQILPQKWWPSWNFSWVLWEHSQ